MLKVDLPQAAGGLPTCFLLHQSESQKAVTETKR
jgi:hypothetical protein